MQDISYYIVNICMFISTKLFIISITTIYYGFLCNIYYLINE